MIFRICINLNVHKINILSIKKKLHKKTHTCDVVGILAYLCLQPASAVRSRWFLHSSDKLTDWYFYCYGIFTP